MTVKIEHVHISLIKIGDTIESNGKTYTIGKDDIGYSVFMGRTLRGDCYSLGSKLVKRVILNQAR
jgi:hypothetical protein